MIQELEKIKSCMKTIKAVADATVKANRSDDVDAQTRLREIVEANRVQILLVVKHARLKSRRETVEEAHARGHFQLRLKWLKNRKL